MSKDKRASLSSGLLGSKDATPLSEDGASSAGSAVASDTARAEPGAHVLYSKGAASASGFRPAHWSYEDEANERTAAAAPAPEPKGTITPFPVAPPVPPPAAPVLAPPRRQGQGRKRVAVAAAVAVLCGGIVGIIVVGLHRPDGKTGVAAAAAPIVPPPVAAPPTVAKPSMESPAAAPRAATPADEVAELMARGDRLLASGDIVAARGFYERAAEHGNAPASTAVGKTYDPLFLEQLRVRGTRGDPGMAAQWYRKASAAGDPLAELQLKRLIARYAG